jgi:hypothetical protein
VTIAVRSSKANKLLLQFTTPLSGKRLQRIEASSNPGFMMCAEIGQ